jgi:ABC-2 type transport system ATP-binding protein
MAWFGSKSEHTPPEYKDAIVLKGLAKYFGDFHAVDGIDLVVRKGEIFGFLGPNGSGKSTTIRMLCGVMDPSGGSAEVLGYDVRKDPERIKERIGYMSQKFSLFEELTVEENMKFYAGIYGISGEKYAERRQYVLKMADLEGRENEMTKNLSVGWKQRLALGCATIHEPELLFLDEPTSGVDPIARRQFWELLYEMAERGVTLFVTTHYMDEATHCHRLAFIYNGNIIAEGSPSEVRGLMKDTILELSVSDVDAALTALEGTAGLEPYPNGALLHVNIGRRTEHDLDLPGLLSAAGVRTESVTAVEPSLEDVFVHLVSAERERAS